MLLSGDKVEISDGDLRAVEIVLGEQIQYERIPVLVGDLRAAVFGGRGLGCGVFPRGRCVVGRGGEAQPCKQEDGQQKGEEGFQSFHG